MKRLTEWWDSYNGLWGASLVDKKDKELALTKLAAYEDLGYEPDEIKKLLNVNVHKGEMLR